MTTNKTIIADVNLGGEWFGIVYHPTQTTAYSADICQKVVGMFTSPVIDCGTDILSWRTLYFKKATTGDSSTQVYVYIKSFASASAADNALWIGPFVSGLDEDISSLKDRYLQVMIVMMAEGDAAPAITPLVSNLSVSAYAAGSAVEFFTQYFDLGFKAEHMLLTYNGTVGDDMLLQFAVYGKDDATFSKYQTLNPNTVVKLDDIPALSTGVKIGVRGMGAADESFVLDEFAILLSSVEGTKTELNS